MSKLNKPDFRISAISQISAIASKQFLLFDRNKGWSVYTKMVGLFIFIFLMSQLPQLSKFLPLFLGIILNLVDVIQFTTTLTQDKLINFRATFKLMGLGDSAYLFGNLIYQLFFVLVWMGYSLAASIICYKGDPTYLVSIPHLVLYIFSYFIFAIASISYYSCVAEVIYDGKSVRDILGMLVCLIVLYPFVGIITNPGRETSVIEWVLLAFSPTGAWNLLNKELYLNNRDVLDLKVMIQFAILNFEAVFFSVLLLFLQSYLSIGGGTSKRLCSLFSSNNNSQDNQISRVDEISKQSNNNNEGLQSPEESSSDRKFLDIRNLSKKFGSFSALTNISQAIYSNQITCILGHNGAGKTTLINTIIGVLSPSSGTVSFKGTDVYSGPHVLSGQVGYCSSHDILIADMTVTEFLIFIAYIKGIRQPMPYVSEIMYRCELIPYRNQFTKNLSGGTRRRTSLASAVLGEPSLIFMDEPSSGVDPENRREIWRLIKAIKSPEKAIILTTHHLEEAEYLSEDVIIMEKGKVHVRGDPQTIMRQFGAGYHIIISNFQDLKLADRVIEGIQSLVPEATIETRSLKNTGKLVVLVPLHQKHLMS